ncbi:hypothetical protein GTP44_10180 [Duganella sp. FT50W]|uniref:Uncharacterized protein n=1 Tax=Duganella lactea TaxID=2692173 RepID=A0A6L8MQA2_9BURK|nr:hypothetical protein [Duganella lactea]
MIALSASSVRRQSGIAAARLKALQVVDGAMAFVDALPIKAGNLELAIDIADHEGILVVSGKHDKYSNPLL